MATRITLLGALSVEIDGQTVDGTVPGRQGRLLLAYLVLNRRRAVGRDELIGILWPDQPPDQPDAVLSTVLSRLRRALGHELLTGRSSLSLDLPADVWIDVEEAESAAAAEADLAAGDAAGALERARAAVDLLEPQLLPEFDAPWVEERRRRLDELAADLLDTAARAGLALGPAELATAERAAGRLIDLEPYRESGYALLMEVHARRGDVAKALQVFDRLRVLLRDELGAVPAAGVTALHERLLARGEDDVAPPAPPLPEAVVVPVPAPLARAERQPFVGRAAELARLRHRWEEACAADAGLVLLTGEAGIGKTRLAARLASEVHADGALVLSGRCDQEGVGPPYEPFAEALAHYARHRPALELEPALAPHIGELRRLLPELGVASEPASEERYRLFEAVVALLTYAAEQQPVLVVLEDLHWADEPTLLLLRQVVRRAQAAPLLVVGTYRDIEVDAAEPLARVLSDLRREHAVQRISLSGLDDAETAALASAHAPAPLAALVRQLRAQTDGNPFFIEEILRSIGETPESGDLAEGVLAAMGVPESIKVTIERRCDLLSPATAEVLTIAAVLGHEFQLGALRVLAEEAGADAIAALDEALESGLVVEYPEYADRFAFHHVLVRDTLYQRLAPGRRWRLHLLAGEVLERGRDQLAVPPAQLAHHFFESRHIGGGERAMVYSAEAAR